MSAAGAESLAALEQALRASRCFGGGSIGGWSVDAAILGPLAAALLLHAAGTLRLWRRAGIGHGVRQHQVLCFLAGWLALAGALVTPLHQASRELFAAHMIEHELVMAVAAPLLVLGRPLPAFLWALPRGLRRAFGRMPQAGWFARPWRALSDPLTATLLHGAAIWGWHAPGPFEAALRIEPVHWLQHLSFLATALLFWWALLARRDRRGAAVGHLFATAMHTGLLGVLLLISPHPWFPDQAIGAAAWGLSPLEDQQLAGAVMWVPAGLIYAGAAVAFAGAWIAESGGRQRALPQGWPPVSRPS